MRLAGVPSSPVSNFSRDSSSASRNFDLSFPPASSPANSTPSAPEVTDYESYRKMEHSFFSGLPPVVSDPIFNCSCDTESAGFDADFCGLDPFSRFDAELHSEFNYQEPSSIDSNPFVDDTSFEISQPSQPVQDSPSIPADFYNGLPPLDSTLQHFPNQQPWDHAMSFDSFAQSDLQSSLAFSSMNSNSLSANDLLAPLDSLPSFDGIFAPVDQYLPAPAEGAVEQAVEESEAAVADPEPQQGPKTSPGSVLFIEKGESKVQSGSRCAYAMAGRKGKSDRKAQAPSGRGVRLISMPSDNNSSSEPAQRYVLPTVDLEFLYNLGRNGSNTFRSYSSVELMHKVKTNTGQSSNCLTAAGLARFLKVCGLHDCSPTLLDLAD